MVAISVVARKLLPVGHLHSDAHQSHRARSHPAGPAAAEHYWLGGRVSIPDVVKIPRIVPDKSITWGLCVPPVGEDGLAVSA
jgi:hypothetical protein